VTLAGQKISYKITISVQITKLDIHLKCACAPAMSAAWLFLMASSSLFWRSTEAAYSFLEQILLYCTVHALIDCIISCWLTCGWFLFPLAGLAWLPGPGLSVVFPLEIGTYFQNNWFYCFGRFLTRNNSVSRVFIRSCFSPCLLVEVHLSSLNSRSCFRPYLTCAEPALTCQELLQSLE